MPNTLSALPSSTYNLSHDPTQSVYGNVGSDISDNPFGEMTDALLFGAVNDFLEVVDDVTGLDLLGIISPLEALLGANTGLLSGLVGFLTPGANTTGLNVLSPIMNLFSINTLAALPGMLIQLGLNAVISLFGFGTPTSGSVGGTSSTSPLGILGAILAIPGDLWSLLFGQQASNQAQIDAINSGGFSYDPAVNGVSGWTNLVGTLTLSTRGTFIQALTETVAYRSSGIASDSYGISFVLDPTMRGVAGGGICADSAGTKWVGLLAYRGFDGDALWLVAAASPTLWVIVKKMDLPGANKMTGLTTLKLRTDGISKFTSTLNDKPLPLLDWTDTGGLVVHNSTHRGVILVSNGLNRNEDSYLGPAFKGKVVSFL